MKNVTKQIIASATALGLLATTTPTLSFAAENTTPIKPSTQSINSQNTNLKILKDDATEKIVESSDQNLISTSTYNKNTKMLNITTKNLTDNTTSTQTINLNNTGIIQKNKNRLASWDIKVLDHGESLDGKWQYTYYNKNVWLIKIPQQNAKNPVENSNNKADLNGFRNSVNALITSEVAFLGKVAGEAALGALALLETPTPWTTLAGAAAAIGIAAWALPDFYKVFQETKNCNYYFHRV